MLRKPVNFITALVSVVSARLLGVAMNFANHIAQTVDIAFCLIRALLPPFRRLTVLALALVEEVFALV